MSDDVHGVVHFQGEAHQVKLGQSVLAASYTQEAADPPEALCGMGSCYACVVVANGLKRVRACITEVQEGAFYDW